MGFLKDFGSEVKTTIKPIYSYLRFILIILIFLLSSVFKLIPVYIFNIDMNNMSYTTSCLLTLFSNSVSALLCILLYYNELKKDFIKLKKMKKDDLANKFDLTFRYWLIGLAIMVVSNFIIGKLGIGTSSNDTSVQSSLFASPFIAGISVVVLAPFIEEMVFRMGFRKIIKGKWVFILTSGIIFGSLHVVLSLSSWYELLYLIPYCSLGIAFGHIYADTDNFYFSFIIHMLHNLLTAFTTFLLAGVIL